MRRKNGFTLIELLVVIAIIAVLMAILTPVLNEVRNQAKGAVCIAHLRQFSLMFAMYTDDYDGYFNKGWDVGEVGLWPNALRPYYKDNEKILLCPMATKLLSRHGLGPYASWDRDIDVPGGGSMLVVSSYTINSWTNYMTKDRGSSAGTRKKEWFWKNTQGVTSANYIPVFGDGTWNDAWPWPGDNPPAFDGEFGGAGSPGSSDEMKHFCIGRHGAFIQMLFMDWSARKVGLKELWTLKWHKEFETAGPWTKAGGCTPDKWPEWMRGFRDY